MPGLRANIYAKGIILISLPLAFEVAFLFAFFQQQAHYDNVLERESSARELIYHANEMYLCLVDAIAQRVGDSLFGIPDRSSAEMLSRTKEEYADLRQIVTGRQDLLPLLNQIKQTTERTVELTDEFEGTAGVGGDFNKMMALKNNLKRFEELQEQILLVGDQMVDFKIHDNLQNSALPAAVVAARAYLKWILASGVLLSFTMTGLLLWYFINGIHKGIRLLLTNTLRLSDGKSLLPASGTADELGQLDQTFHNMAAALEAANRRERAAINNAADMICVLDRAHRITSVNPAGEALLGCSRDSLIDTEFDRLVVPDECNAFRDELNQAVEQGTSASFEKSIQRSDGATVATRWTVQWSERDQVLFCVAQDVTKERRLSELKQAFSAMISDELRRPLTSIQTFLSRVNHGEQGAVAPEASAEAARAEESTRRLIGLVNDLLDLEERAVAKIDLHPRLVNLDEIVEKAGGSLALIAAQKEVAIRTDYKNVELYGDPDRLVQVLVNLIANALKFSPAGEEVLVRCVVHEDSFEFRISDRGRGIPDSQLTQLFAPYSQLDGKEDKEQGGTGLGLAICKEIIELHGGTIGVESEEGKGSTFWFRLPRGSGSNANG